MPCLSTKPPTFVALLTMSLGFSTCVLYTVVDVRPCHVQQSDLCCVLQACAHITLGH